MKITGEKELLTEDMYNVLEEEYTQLVDKTKNYISNLDINYFEELTDACFTLQCSNEIVQTLYKADLEVYMLKAIINLSKQNKLLVNIIYKLKFERDKINIYNTAQLEQYLKDMLYLYSILNNNNSQGEK